MNLVRDGPTIKIGILELSENSRAVKQLLIHGAVFH